ncbi:hypothetical protein [Kineococcus esterisolvens]
MELTEARWRYITTALRTRHEVGRAAGTDPSELIELDITALIEDSLGSA